MAFKFAVFAAIVAVANAVAIGYPAPLGAYHAPLGAYPAVAKVAAPLAYPAVAKVAAPLADYDPNPQYSYSYAVSDALTGDNKNQQESRSGDVVTGSYSLVEPDGTRRVVEYTADPVNGFNAVVHREPLAVKAVAPIAKYAAPLAYPAVAKVAAPYSYSYAVSDALTGDNKEQQESRSGDVVTGSYSLVEPDGTRRVVEYTADPVNGFNAVVHREPLAVKAVAPIAKIAAPLAYPAVAKVAAPIAPYGYPAYGKAILG
ncbi:cuticle protein 21-like [Anopheles nili]|uniref:cuticle protein 21-like n=1 Tax=Anopheles nili TaxID=185578 RepID=UPI00237C0783|nr:cuticle protein 21-like [Anopheles nili]